MTVLARLRGRRLEKPSVAREGALARIATALAVTSMGALAVGALAVGALSIGSLAIKTARIRRLELDELLVGGKPLTPTLS
jgi:hypothetical protein